MPAYHIAQYNIARMRWHLDDPRMHGFVSRLDELNHLADRTPGCVWRYVSDNDTATSLRPYKDDPLVIINLSVWDGIDALHAFAYRGDHGPAYAARHDWFEPMDGHTLVLWWVPAGMRPTPLESKQRLELLRMRGPTPDAFTFKVRYGAPAALSA
jgi:hypothetical protein